MRALHWTQAFGWVTVLLLVCRFDADAGDAKKRDADELPKDLKELQGRWIPVGDESDGKYEPAIPWLQAITRRVIMGNTFAYYFQDIRQSTFEFRVDASKMPREIDFVSTDGEAKKRHVRLAIYELQGDTLKICYAGTDGKRPTTFATKGKPGQSVYTLQREK